jgi:Tol biopolymer transport system component
VTGDPQQVTRKSTLDWRPSLSADGRKLVFLSDRTGQLHVWSKDLGSGVERQLTLTTTTETWCSMNPDGSKVAYEIYENNKPIIYVMPASGGGAEKVCEDCGAPWNWSSDGKSFLYRIPGRKWGVGLFCLATAERTEPLKHSKYNLLGAQFSPNDRWIALEADIGPGRSRLFVVPYRKGSSPEESEWIPVTNESDGVGNPSWSPDGNLLYFISNRDGFSCYWAQRLDPVTKHPRGPAFPVYHSHRARYPLGAFSVARDRIVFS